ncbi:hypothetical protein D770_04805 [Flammeovirgaceae bacterium 311]|nr:hypothetical protein D770_04805 [Flammeovirgaceae bacterium 311]
MNTKDEIDLIYLKRSWEEYRADEFNYWGCSIWYFETDTIGVVKRQLESYDKESGSNTMKPDQSIGLVC